MGADTTVGTMDDADGRPPTAHTPFGLAVGRNHQGTAVFKGIAFARARRLERAELVDRWPEPVHATSYGPRAPQLPGALEKLLGNSSVGTSEDCLSLNVFTPACDDGRRPVLVWVHGGAFVTGSGSMPWYHGSSLARRGDVVVVTFNYRLGALGFTGAANLGLHDQLLALTWVRHTIASFGGDPDNVTVFGESAGGASVIALMAASADRALFARAWSMSPSIPQLRGAALADRMQAELLEGAGVGGLRQFRELPLDDILRAQRSMLADPARSLVAFGPSSDADVLPDDIVTAAANDGRSLVIGTTRDEMHLFTAFDPRRAALDDAGLAREFGRVFGERSAAAMAAYRRHRRGAAPGQLASALQTDEMFRAPARRLAATRAAARLPVWMYWFTYPTPAFGGVLGSCHGLDIPYAFHNLDRPGVEMFTGAQPQRVHVADAFSDALVRFARTGDPGWPRYDLDARTTRRFDVDTGDLHEPEPELAALWDDLDRARHS